MIDVLDLVDVPKLGIEKATVIGRTYGTNLVTVQDPSGFIHKDLHFADCIHSDKVKRLHAARPSKTTPTVEVSDPAPSDHPDEGSDRPPSASPQDQ